MNITKIIVILFAIKTTFAEEGYRKFSNTKGESIEAKALSINGGKVTILRKSDNRKFTIEINNLSQIDREFLNHWLIRKTKNKNTEVISFKKINQLIGQPLFSEKSLWESSAKVVADRLKWKQESMTKFSESYRRYPQKGYLFLGTHPHSLALYGNNEKVNSLSIVFANKGDSFKALGSATEHFKNNKPTSSEIKRFEEIMENDVEIITSNLTSLLGNPSNQKFGEGESRTSVKRWDWSGHSFLLAYVPEEYVALSIETVKFSDDRGKLTRTSDSEIREKIRNCVEVRENSDVIINDIPMVDQGPKGYCAPATVERCMRFMGISADMYLLANIGKTNIGGGTSMKTLFGNIGRDIKRKGRSFDEYSGELKMRIIKKHIDDGIPIIWGMQSTSQFNDIADHTTRMRNNEEWENYKKNISDIQETKLSEDKNRSHVVIIIGYNEDTEEIAFSDSWGERYKERWISLKQSKQISNGKYYTISL
tara:strand:+ start:809 stop:2248 length:1440 start_codon:yes stop_codon:yes gene_type:complete